MSTEKLVKCLKKVCHHPCNSKETQITAAYWGMAYAYQAAPKNNPCPTVEIATNPTHTACTMAEQESKPSVMSVTPTANKKQNNGNGHRLF